MGLEPAKLSEFRLAGALGAGATAKVYEAVHLVTGRAVAIKLMEPSEGSAEMRERFAREARILSGVQSRHVGKILGFGFDRGHPFLVLERLHGETLDAKLRRDGPVPPDLAVRWIEQLIIGVRDCHDGNVIHRDIKPSNIFLHVEAFEENAKLIDFGVARLREISGEREATGLTGTNHLIGSMGYMAPEQFTGAKSVGFPADLYAIGVVVFRTLTGRLPFVSRSLDAVIRMKIEQPVPVISDMPGMPQNTLLDWFVQRAMMREPDGRFQSAREMLEQWWNVMASLDAPVVGGTSPPGPESVPPPTRRLVTAPPSTDAADTEEHTVRRPALPSRPDKGSHAPPSTTLPAFSAAALRRHDEPRRPTPSPGRPGGGMPPSGHARFADVTEETTATSRPFWEMPRAASESVAPTTSPDPIEDLDADDDHPTRNDASLRKLVEQELALEKARQRGE